MNKEIIINAGRLESRVAILEDGQLAELHVEREPKVAGSIYKGRITNVVTGMDAAFADIGLERNAFLCVDDIILRREEQEVLGVPAPASGKHPPINRLVRPNQEVLLQVVRAPVGSKGARVTTRISLPGRYVVLMLHTNGAYVGVSRKITDEKERARLRELGEKLRPEHHSIILRTESEGKGIREIRKDLSLLTQLAERIAEKSRHVSAPALLHQELALIFKVMRDSLSREVTRVLVDDPRVFEDVRDLVAMVAPSLKKRIIHYSDPTPIFTALGIEQEIERLLKRRVRLPSGGHITVDTTEALVAVDVNSGRYTGGADLEDTIVHTNLEAAREIARQLRLRDLGGIIVLDFIDMERAKHRQQVAEALSEALKRDRAKIKVHPIGPLGLVEMTRKRTGENLMELLTDPCPYCSGTGMVKDPVTTALQIERELARVGRGGQEAALVRAHPRVVATLVGADGEYAAQLSRELGKPLYLRAVQGHLEEYTIEQLSLAQVAERVKIPAVDDELEVEVIDQDPSLGAEALGLWEGYLVSIAAPGELAQPRVRVRVTQVSPSLARAELVPCEEGVEPATKKRRRRRRKKTEPELPELTELAHPTLAAVESEEIAAVLPQEGEPASEPGEEEVTPTKRRRRRRRRKAVAAESSPALSLGLEAETPPVPAEAISPAEPAAEAVTQEAPASKRRRRRRHKSGAGEAAVPAESLVATAQAATAEPAAAPQAAEIPPPPTSAGEAEVGEGEATPSRKRRHRGRRRRSGSQTADAPEGPTDEQQVVRLIPELPVSETTPGTATEVTPSRSRRRRPRRRHSASRTDSQAVLPAEADSPIGYQPEPEPASSVPAGATPGEEAEARPRRWRWPRLRRGEG